MTDAKRKPAKKATHKQVVKLGDTMYEVRLYDDGSTKMSMLSDDEVVQRTIEEVAPAKEKTKYSSLVDGMMGGVFAEIREDLKKQVVYYLGLDDWKQEVQVSPLHSRSARPFPSMLQALCNKYYEDLLPIVQRKLDSFGRDGMSDAIVAYVTQRTSSQVQRAAEEQFRQLLAEETKKAMSQVTDKVRTKIREALKAEMSSRLGIDEFDEEVTDGDTVQA